MGFDWCTSILFMDAKHLRDLSLHGSLIWEVCSGRSSSNGGNIWTLIFVGLFILTIGPYSTILEGHFPLGNSSLPLFPLSRTQLATTLNKLFNIIIQLDVVLGVVVVPFMKVTVLWLISLGWVSNCKVGFDSYFLKFYVSTVLLDLLPRRVWWRVLVVLSMHSSVGIILPLMELLPDWAATICITGSGIVKPCIRFSPSKIM